MKKFLLIITITITLILFTLFSDKANEVSKPYLAEFIESKIDKNIQIDIEEYKLDYNYITILAKVNKRSPIKIYGRFNALSKDLDINYTIESVEKIVTIKDITIPPNTTIHGNIKSQIKGVEASIDGVAISDIANLTLKNGKLNLDTMELSTKFILDIENLKNISFITKRDLKGELKIAGDIEKKGKRLHIKGVTNSFDGEIDFSLLNERVSANIKKISVEKISHTLNYPLILSAPLSGKLNYNLKTKQGRLDSDLTGARVIKNRLTELVKKFTGTDLTREVYTQTTLNAKLDKKSINFKLLAKSKRNQISIYDSKLNRVKNHINAKYRVDIDGKDIKGKIKGDINSPKITIDSSKFIEKKVKSVIDKYIDKKHQEKIKSRLKDFGLDEEKRDKAINKAKDFLKGFL